MERQIRILMIAIVLALISSCAKKPLHTSKYFSSEVKETLPESVEWVDNLKYDDKSQIAYGIFNNDSDLVIRVMARDQATIMKMFMTGFTVWIDTTGRKEEHFGVKYPLAQGRSEMERDRTRPETGTAKQRQGQSQEKLARLQTALNSIEIIGFSPEAQASVALNTKGGDGISAWIDLESEMDMYYELKIPLKDLAINTQKMISIGFESGAIEVPSGGPPGGGRSNFGMNAGGGPPGGGGRSGGGGGQQQGDGAGPPQGQTEMKAMSQAIDLWIKRIQLSH